MANLSPLPRETAIVGRVPDPQTGRLTLTGLIASAWDNWLSELAERLNDTPNVLVTKTLTAQGASISATAFALPDLSPGLYRISYHARISRAGSVSSSLTVTMGYTNGAVSCTQAGAAMTGNTTATVQGGVVIVDIDQNTSITYATTYADGGGGTSMQYRLSMTVEQL